VLIEMQTERLVHHISSLKSWTQCEFAIIGRAGRRRTTDRLGYLGYPQEHRLPNFVTQEGEDQENPTIKQGVMKLLIKMREGQERVRKQV
jgi:hypothetical protein